MPVSTRIRKLPLLLATLLFGVAFALTPNPQRETASMGLEVNGEFSCTATAIGPHAIMTASHCTEEEAKYGLAGIGPITVFKAFNDGADHVILLVDAEFKVWTPLMGTRHPVKGEEVQMYGWAGGYAKLFRQGYVVGFVQHEGKDLILLAYPGAPGDSGAAVYAADGTLVAVHAASWGPFKVAYPLKFSVEQIADATVFQPKAGE